MTSAETSETNEVVAREATQIDALQLGDLTLIGVAGPADARRALILLASGKVVTGLAGDTTPAGTIEMVGEDRVLLRRRGKVSTLKLIA
jgi:hypothetical protein